MENKVSKVEKPVEIDNNRESQSDMYENMEESKTESNVHRVYRDEETISNINHRNGKPDDLSVETKLEGDMNVNYEGTMDDDEDMNTHPIPTEHITFKDLDEKKEFLKSPLPRRYGIVKCFIQRRKTGIIGYKEL